MKYSERNTESASFLNVHFEKIKNFECACFLIAHPQKI